MTTQSFVTVPSYRVRDAAASRLLVLKAEREKRWQVAVNEEIESYNFWSFIFFWRYAPLTKDQARANIRSRQTEFPFLSPDDYAAGIIYRLERLQRLGSGSLAVNLCEEDYLMLGLDCERSGV